MQQVPFFAAASNTDEAIAKAITDAIALIAETDKSVLQKSDPPVEELLRFNSKINKLLLNVPYGATQFNKLDFSAKAFSWTHQIGTDKRIAASSSFPGAGIRQVLQQTQLDNAILRNSNVTSPLASATITQGVRGFPQLASTKLDYPAGGFIGRILFPFGVSFLLPIFVVMLVKEKEDRIQVMMTMNGMSPVTYFASHYITFYLLFMLSSLVFIGAGYGAKLTLFTQTSFPLLLLLFFVWGLSQNALVFLLASLFSRSRNALGKTSFQHQYLCL